MITIEKKPTLKTIAYMTGLGVTTVSKALKDAPDIKQSTKDRVKQIARQVGYRPDRAATLLRTGKTHVISLVLSTEEEFSDMSTRFMIGISEALKQTCYHVVLTPYWFEDDPMKPIRTIVDNRDADGILFSRVELVDQRISYLHKAGIPFVTHGRSDMGIAHAYYDFDVQACALKAVRLLADLGSKRTCLITPPMNLAFASLMLNGFNEGLVETGIENYALTDVTLDDSVEKTAAQVATVMQKKIRPDSFVCFSAKAAIGVASGVERSGFVVGKDVNIVAKQSSANFLKWFNRKIYDIEEDFSAAGYAVANSLLRIIDGEPVTDHQQVVFPEVWGQSVLR